MVIINQINKNKLKIKYQRI